MSNIIEKSEQPRPWTRYWARKADTLFFCLISGFCFGLCFQNFIDSVSLFSKNNVTGDILWDLMILPIAFTLESICLSLFGTTPGKFILGVEIKPIIGHRIPILNSLKRNFKIYTMGSAFGIPLISALAYWVNYTSLKDNKETIWDTDNFKIAHKDLNLIRILGYLFYVFSLIFIVVFLKNLSNE